MSIVRNSETVSDYGITWHKYINHYDGECSEMAPKIDNACNTIVSNNSTVLKAEVLTIKGLISGLTIGSSWQDAIGESYQNVITSCTNSLGEVVNSISETFKPSEDVYRKLKAWLKALSANNENYSAYNARKPNPEKDCYKDIITTMDPTTNTSSIEKVFNETVYKSDLQKWASNMERYYYQVIRLEKDIEDFLSQLDSYNESSVAIDTSSSSPISVSLNKMQLDIENNITTKPETSKDTIEYENLFKSDGTKSGDIAVIWNFLKYKGLNDVQAAGVLGNIQRECSFNRKDENSIGAYGIIQWLDVRREGLQKFAKAKGVTEDNLEAQLEYLWEEVFEDDSSYRKTLTQNGFFTTNDPKETARLFDKKVEISGDTKTYEKRSLPAEEIYKVFAGKGYITQEDVIDANKKILLYS